MSKKVIVIGAGFSGLAAATKLADQGYNVSLLEKNNSTGGRARQFKADGFTFDMGPSWYWMPDVFDQYFNSFGKKVNDYYNLIRLDPSYAVFFGKNQTVDLPAGIENLYALFEKHEPGSSSKLEQFLREAAYKYEVGMNEFVHKPGHSIMEFADLRILQSLFRLQMFTSIDKHIKKLFNNEKLVQILEFPVLFLGATPENTPALYSLMNHADMTLGTWYPMGGMHKIVEAMTALAEEKGVNIFLDNAVKKLEIKGGKVQSVITNQGQFDTEVVVASADYHHIEQSILEESHRSYSKKYWDKRVMAPSSLLFYLGINKKLKGLHHHNLFFDEDFKLHAYEIYESPQWPSKPLFYVCAPSVTDNSVAPEGCENIFILMPAAPDLEDSEEKREYYFNIILDRLEALTEQNIRDHIIYKRSYAHQNFIEDYNSFKGNAYGLANTLMQTAFLKPKMRSKKVANLFYTGQLTTPGPGVPPSLISGQVVAKEVHQFLQ